MPKLCFLHLEMCVQHEGVHLLFDKMQNYAVKGSQGELRCSEVFAKQISQETNGAYGVSDIA
jgi:hypothetical protein